MREMGTVELLTREGEIVIAKRIEEGINQVQISVAEYPEAITYLLEQWDKFEAEEMRLSDIISGFFDPNNEDESQISATHIGSELTKSSLTTKTTKLTMKTTMTIAMMIAMVIQVQILKKHVFTSKTYVSFKTKHVIRLKQKAVLTQIHKQLLQKLANYLKPLS